MVWPVGTVIKVRAKNDPTKYYVNLRLIYLGGTSAYVVREGPRYPHAELLIDHLETDYWVVDRKWAKDV